jgi:hypothetical protein
VRKLYDLMNGYWKNVMNNVKQLIILYTIEAYLDDISNETTYNFPFMLKLRTAIRGYMTFHRFNNEEYKYVMKIADTDVMKKMTEIQVDRTIFALEMLYLYVKEIPKKERANLNISDKKLLKAKAELITDMLKLRQRNEDSYKRVKEIIDDSRLAAKRYYYFIKDYDETTT